MKLTRTLVSLGLSLCLAAPALAGAGPQQTIADGAEAVRGVLKVKTAKGSKAETEQKAKLKKVVDGFLDYKELSARALGPHWKDRSEAERAEFVELLRDLIEASYTGAIRSNADFTLAFQTEEVEEDGAKAHVAAVASAKTKKGKALSEDLLFHLFLVPASRAWMIYDVEFGDISLVRHYRGEFNRKIKKEGYPALLAAMKKKLGEIESGKVEKKMTL
ncbi:MAG TPA: ABC transporter substrate-binding protein [Myxococcota bacterium]|nr:ABC transporter substrate-binding protein [Myxococcota bacterium]HRY94791.1 ABC transporter substrate-binding protein [Myxococcota bacterium]